ncbi:hypothetical protein, partial [Paraburkholderia sp. NMBU_R16]|uniref:hypothetical protein n=1 Tax=Paraburkholderia sp. NMBU_R16 TaxID=2698676 RepID=UPI001C252C85
VVVVIGDPPTDRGQLAQPLNLEDISPVEIQLLNRPRKRVTPNGLGPLRSTWLTGSVNLNAPIMRWKNQHRETV